MKTILFVCTGNVCRSPMAEGLLRQMLKGSPEFRVLSAGLGALDGHPPSEAAVQAMAEVGVDISDYRSRSLRVSLLEEADFIFTMTCQQQDAIQTIYPAAAEKTFVLREFEDPEVVGRDISDPIGQSLEIYRRTRDQIRAALPSILEFVKQTEAAARKTVADVAATEPAQPRRIALAADHGGVQMKAAIKQWLAQRGYPFADFGTHSTEPVDYPEYAFIVAREIARRQFRPRRADLQERHRHEHRRQPLPRRARRDRQRRTMGPAQPRTQRRQCPGPVGARTRATKRPHRSSTIWLSTPTSTEAATSGGSKKWTIHPS